MAGSTGTPRARALGAELRLAREAVGIGQRELARELGMNSSTLSRMESGERAAKPEDVARILTALKVSAEEVERVLALAREPDNGPGWLAVGMPEQAVHLAAMLEFERTASSITDVSMTLVPGLLQTADYARAIIGGGGVPSADVPMRVAVRLGRREVIQRRGPAQFHALVGEAALRGRIGGTSVIRDQLEHLLTVAKLPHIDLRVVPIETSWHPGLVTPFTLYEYAAATPIVHLETSRSGLFLHEPDDVAEYQAAISSIRAVALPPEMSIEMVANMIDRLE